MTSVRCYKTTVEALMVTENNVPEQDSAESTGAEQVPLLNEESSSEPTSVTEAVPQTEEQAVDTAQPTETTISATPSEGTSVTDRTYSQEEFRKLQSSNDKRIAELEKANKQMEEQAYQARKQAEESNLNQQVEVYQEQQRQKLIAQGMDEMTAQQISQEQSAFAKRAFLTEIANRETTSQNQKLMGEINQRSQQARAYELATQNGINYSELDGISDPVAMEKVAKALGRAAKLEQRLQSNTSPSTYGTSQPAVDVAPTDAESIIDRYNSGDPGISTEQANSAAKKLGMPDLI